MNSRDEYCIMIDAIEDECSDITKLLGYIRNIINHIKTIKKTPDFFSAENFINLDTESKIEFLKYAVKNLFLNEFMALITYCKSIICSKVINDFLLLLINSISKFTKCNQKLVCQTIELLIELGCDIGYENHSATILASTSRNFILQIILSHGGDACVANNMPIRQAVKFHENLDNIILLVNYGADIHTQNDYIFRYAVYSNSINLINYCLDNGVDVNINNGIAIKYSIYNNSKIFDTLISHGADINYIDGNDIFNLVQNCNLKFLQKLSDLGVRIDQLNSVRDDTGKCDKYYATFQFLQNNGVFDKNIIFALYDKED
ncbi:ankyrin repeat protein [Megavirus baoshan]|uniref:Putative ankyrin repeat protein n=1 Tax=Megavirus baoshan TaxID=2496520 RepID=A0A3S8UWF3_9VIRU|nr:ankyrin repeat protein [Megavirus baoshan]AZL89146.1 ankyrin repeat protein [Megavirus baoshan]